MQTSFSCDNMTWQFFHVRFWTRKCINGCDHFIISFPFILDVSGFRVVDIMLFCDSVQSVDTWITTCESFFQDCSRTEILISFFSFWMNKDEIQLLTFQWIFVCQIYHLFYFFFFFGLRCVCRFPAMLGF